MHFTTSLLATVTLASTTLAAPAVEARATTLKPWQLTGLVSYSPPGRPDSYPWSTITINLTDPNSLDLGTSRLDNTTVTIPAGNKAVNCKAEWLRGENPFGHSWRCDPSG